MGTRCDFYVGRGKSAEWIGSYPFDGYPDGVVDDQHGDGKIIEAATEEQFRTRVAALLATDGGTTPERGWPWPWNDSGTTDYSYAFDGQVWVCCFGHKWMTPSESLSRDDEDEGDGGKACVFPDMSARKNVTMGRRSGMIAIAVGPNGAGIIEED